ncbi:hypothetical protein ACFVKB_40985 [Rhodococcus sp. NPDC127530]|uniref:hypothetical protein n=1 Tax=Rhodococcus sp. NPDC127530 TaxID=3345397 RepID=UPI00363D9863
MIERHWKVGSGLPCLDGWIVALELPISPALSSPPTTQIVPAAVIAGACWRAIGATVDDRHVGAHCMVRGASCGAIARAVDSA